MEGIVGWIRYGLARQSETDRVSDLSHKNPQETCGVREISTVDQGGKNATVVCVWMPNCALRVLSHRVADWATPLATVSVDEAHPSVIDANPAASEYGIGFGSLASRALGMCPDLELIPYDQARCDAAFERMLLRIESVGAAVAPDGMGRALFDGAGLMDLYGGMDGVVAKVRSAFRKAEDLRIGVGPNPFLATVAARMSKPNGTHTIEDNDVRHVLRRLPLTWLDLSVQLMEVFDALGIRTCGDLAGIDRDQVSDRFGAEGLRLHQLSIGIDDRVFCTRVPQDSIVERIEFPDPIANELVWKQALRMLIDRLMKRGELHHYMLHSITVRAKLLTGTTWQHRKALRNPTRHGERIFLAASAGMEQIPAPITMLEVSAEQIVRAQADQIELTHTEHEKPGQIARGVHHVQTICGDESVLQVMEVNPQSRIPEHRAILIPMRSDGAA